LYTLKTIFFSLMPASILETRGRKKTNSKKNVNIDRGITAPYITN